MLQPISNLKWPVFAAALAALLLLTACGKKGPLYLPDKPPPADSKPAQK